MADVEAAKTAPTRLDHLVDCLAAVPGFDAVLAKLHEGEPATLDGVWGSACALAAAAVAGHTPGTLLLVVPQASEVDDLVDELRLFGVDSAESFALLQPRDDEPLATDEAAGGRLRVLNRLRHGHELKVVVASMPALLQPVPTPKDLAAHTREIAVGGTLDADELARWLVEQGFHHQTAVELPGEFSLRGGILDLFAPEWFEPVRVELFGDEVESIRRFDTATQRSTGRVESMELTAIAPPEQSGQGHLADYLADGSWALMFDPAAADEQGRHFLDRLDGDDPAYTVPEVFKRLSAMPLAAAEAISSGAWGEGCRLQIESVDRFSGDMARIAEELEQFAGRDRVWMVCQTEGEIQRLVEIFAGSSLRQEGRLQFITGRLRGGFRLVQAGETVLSTTELFHRPDPVRLVRRRKSRAIDSFLDLREGDLVVHVGHGIARYRGMRLLEQGDQREEHLELEFDGATKLFVPAARIHLVQKYIGGTKARPKLAKLGGRSWLRQKQQAEEAVLDLAHDMLELQAARASRPGISFPDDSDWQREFDAAFPYTETPDQWQAIGNIKQDMQRSQPMDRLICGDVGYGKTELAMRAAFKAVDAGYQVGVLVPTTVLAEQHYRTFTSRLAEFPFEIRLLSRFLTRGQQHKVLEEVKQGAVDIVIGTHRLAQADVRFQNLGLVIIDEEQRFGVEVKERLKALRQIVDVLTLTATPIPRTLHMSLLGLRDISNLETPPEDRLAVETKVTRFDESLIRHAVLRELNREGQVYFVHNRVADIDVVAKRLQRIVPDASIGIGHGQMNEHELEDVMRRFVEHRFDILLATTIIENGLDIPNANTIFIDEADRYGLADLHQLRGRVGRYKHRAYCYLLVDPGKTVTPVAAKRLRAIEEFSHMGAGFAIAMRDLEIRGAGNVLGTSQSGHIAAVGYELYCQLLEKTVRQLKSLPPKRTVQVDVDLPGSAHLPRDYIHDQRAKIDLYRRLSWAAQASDLDDLADEMRDRFGEPPEEVQRLLRLTRLRIWAQDWRLRSIRREDKYLHVGYEAKPEIEQLRRRSDNRLRIVDDRSAYLPIDTKDGDAARLYEELESLLRPE